MNEIKINSCPFCGYANPKIDGIMFRYVKCEGCDAQGPMSNSEQVAVKKWNGVKAI